MRHIDTTPDSMLVQTWVTVTDEHGRERLVATWGQAPTPHSAAPAA